MKFFHNFQDEPINFSTPEVNDGKSEVEVAGYITAQQRIENMILAGKRLNEYRKQQYDFQIGEPINENFFDPTRSKNFDLADASQMYYDIDGRIRASQASQEQPETPLTDDPDLNINNVKNPE